MANYNTMGISFCTSAAANELQAKYKKYLPRRICITSALDTGPYVVLTRHHPFCQGTGTIHHLRIIQIWKSNTCFPMCTIYKHPRTAWHVLCE
jgi:hypothetical protein